MSLKNKKSQFLIFISVLSFSIMFYSCISPRVEVQEEECSRNLLGKGIKNKDQLAGFFLSNNPSYDDQKIIYMAELYIQESGMENINSDVAFVQMCLETGFLRYGNLVTPEMNNFCGLGAIDAEHPGETFPDMQTGVRAHIQHLQAYATPSDVKLNNPLVDPRYSWVHKAKSATTVFELAGSWAADRQYGAKLDNLLTELEAW